MATTEVILREKVDNLGAEADVVTVRRGYARNFLVPSGKAFEATPGNLRHIEHLKQVRAQREAEELAEAEKIATKLRKTKLSMELSIGQGGKAFGSITSADIAKALEEKAKVEIDRHNITLDKPIKGTGDYEIPVKVHADIEVIVALKVKAEKEDSDDEASDSAE
ncbi:MAG: 50S ribosomal protein L9 [Verrucomicrobiae bacterium]|nr:50S ribosomal protein L9 [Verrucomicrobiae bacterium]